MNINKIVAHINRNPYQKDTHFEVTIGIPNVLQGESYDNSFLGLSCNSAIVPGISIETEGIQKAGYGRVVERPKGHTLAGLSLTFYVDEGGLLMDYFNAWTNRIIGDTDTGVRYEQPYFDDIIAPLTIQAYSTQGEPTWSVDIDDVFPKDVGDIEMTWAGGDGVMQLAVGFAYSDIRKKRGATSSNDERVVNPIQANGRGEGVLSTSLGLLSDNGILSI